MLKIIFLLFMGTGMPVAIAMAGSSLVYILATGNLPPFVVIHRMVSGIDSFPLLAVPFFMLAGEIMNVGGLSRRIVKLAMTLVGHVRGGLGYVAVVAAIIMASISGSAVADTAALAALLVGEGRRDERGLGTSQGHLDLDGAGGGLHPAPRPTSAALRWCFGAHASQPSAVGRRVSI